MQLIRADQILGLLANFAVLGRQQLGRYRGIEHILQHIGQLAERAVGLIGNKVAHQRFRDRAVHAVHTHVVAIIGRPAERQLGQVARADHHAAVLVGEVHQHQCTHTRLTVLKGDRQIVLGLADVHEMLIDRRLDIHGLECNAVGFRQLFCVALGAGGRAEARHGDSQNALAVELQHIECVYEHDERERGIQSAGQADNRRFRVRMAQTGGKAGRLKRQNLLAAFIAERLIRRNERRARERAVGKVVFHRRKRERLHMAIRRLEGVHALALMCKALEVDIRVNDALREHLALGQQCAVLRDQVVARKNEVLRGLTETGICIQVRTQQSAGLLTNKVAAVARLADDLIRSGQVDDDVRAHLRQRGGRRVRHPQVLADLHAKGEQRLLIALEDRVRHQRHTDGFAVRILDVHALHSAGQRIRRYKMALLVELGVVRKMGFRHKRQHVTGIDDSGHIIQLAAHAQRQTDYDDSRKLCGLAADRVQRVQRTLEQRFLQKQIAAGIAGQAQLGECDELRAFGSGLLRQLYDLRGIICTVRDVQIRRCRGNFDKSISHR